MYLDELWDRHRHHLKLRRIAAYTLVSYDATRRALGEHLHRVGHSLQAEAVTVHDLRGFIALQERGLADGGVDAHFRALRGVFGWATQDELITRNPTHRLERPQRGQRLLPTLEMTQLMALLAESKRGSHRLRDAALLVTLFDTGLRLAEVASLTLADLHLDQGHLRVVGKGNKERLVPLGMRSTEALDRFIRKERRPRHPSVQQVFLNRQHLPMTRSGVSQLLADLAERAKVPRGDAAPHAFRRAFAVNYLRNGGDVFSLQHVLGHASLEMTRRYVNLLPEDLKATRLRVSPGDRL